MTEQTIHTTVRQTRITTAVAAPAVIQTDATSVQTAQVIYAGRQGADGQPPSVHPFTSPAATWTITHGLGRLPGVQVIVADTEVVADIEYPDMNTVVVTHAVPVTGTVLLI